jgi:hypothetical protein
MIERFPHLLALPPELINGRPLFIHEQLIRTELTELLALAGLTPSCLVGVATPTFVARLHITSPNQVNGGCPMLVRWMCEMFLDKLNLKNVSGNIHLVMQRAAEPRKIRHFEKLFGAIWKEYPNRNWQVYRCPGTIESQIKLFRNCSLVLGMRGGGFSNVIWMVRGSIVIMMQTRICDIAYHMWELYFGMKVYETVFSYATNWKPVFVDVGQVLGVLRLALS